MNDRYERIRDAAEGEGRATTAVQVTLFGRECFLPADIAQEVEQACAAHDLADGEEIMVSVEYDVYTLPLQPSGLSSGPRFVVHVPGPEQQPKARGVVDGCHCATCTCNPGMTPAIRFDTSPAAQEGAVRDHLIALGWTPPGSQQPAAESANVVQKETM